MFVVYDFTQSCQVPDLANLAQLAESLKSNVVWMLEALHGLSGQETDSLGKTVPNAKACAICVPLCQQLGLVKLGTYPEVPSEKFLYSDCM